ncbi:MAG: DUF1579 domain-containing protein [Caulobacter sp. 12-67-6]|nr:MAG: DUF1579 domain-containing protein [Caulobacter sp. 12-67-6]OYX70268.1 MAG: DUF1579 domain-containing protein [Caulobacter sp. 32-67-35]OYX97933.1 MAG: DUF1579 domain-containing protein [Caulobacter sp. 35-67-4]
MFRPLACVTASLAAVAILVAAPAQAQAQSPDPAPRLAAQKQAMARLDAMDGVWRGPAWTLLADGRKHELTQTERIGPLLDGAIKVLEGRGYEADGATSFNALGVISYEPSTDAFTLHSHAMSQKGDFSLKPTADGYVWEIPAGPMVIRYTAVIRDGAWREIGERVMPDRPPMQFFEMNLKRVSDSAWPAAGAVAPR